MGKFDAKLDEGIYLGYFSSSKAYRVYNHRTLVIEESIHVVFAELNTLDLQKTKEIGVDVLFDKLNLNESNTFDLQKKKKNIDVDVFNKLNINEEQEVTTRERDNKIISQQNDQ